MGEAVGGKGKKKKKIPVPPERTYETTDPRSRSTGRQIRSEDHWHRHTTLTLPPYHLAFNSIMVGSSSKSFKTWILSEKEWLAHSQEWRKKSRKLEESGMSGIFSYSKH